MKGLDYALGLIDKGFMAGMKQAIGLTKTLDHTVNKVNRHVSGTGKAAKSGFNGLSQTIKKTSEDMNGFTSKAKKGIGGMNASLESTKRKLIDTGASGSRSMNGLNGTIRTVRNSLVGLFAVAQISAFTGSVKTATTTFEGLENTIRFASGKEANTNMTFLDDTIKRLNMDMQASYKGFQTISGAMKGTALEGQATRDIFEGIATAGTIMNLKADQMEGALLAVSQMASKGKVQAEELRGQLGERLPGAFNIAAKSMGVTQEELNNMLDKGQVYAEDFLPKFAKELKNTFQDGLPAAANSMQAATNKQNNALTSLKRTLGESMRPAFMMFSENMAGFYNWLNGVIPLLEPVRKAMVNLGQAFMPVITAIMGIAAASGGASGIIDQMAGVINTAATIVEVLSYGMGFLIENYKIVIPAIAGYIAMQKLMALVQMAAAAKTTVLAIATQGLNAAFAANPIGLTILALAALSGAVIYAYNKVSWFRGGIMAAWEVIKGFGNIIKDYVITRFQELLSGITGIGKSLYHLFTGDWAKAWEAGKKAANGLMGGNAKKQLIQDALDVGKKAANAYKKGASEASMATTADDSANALVSNGSPNSNNITAPGGSPTGNGPSTSVAAGSGTGGNREITFNIQSFVKELTIHTTNLKENPQEVKAIIERLFFDILRDLETRVDL
jgi:tape measure domain-containing protein